MNKIMVVVMTLISAWAHGANVGSYPNAGALVGNERFLAQQGAATVNITPVQIEAYICANAPSLCAGASGITAITGDCAAAGSGSVPITCTATNGIAFGSLATQSIAQISNGGTGTSTPGLIAGTSVTITGSWPNQTISASSGGTPAFSTITSGTNASAAMVVGTGSSLTTSGSGSITASALASGVALGTPASGTLTNATGLPISTGVSGLGTGIATALAVNVGTAGSPVVNGGALGTPSSGTLTSATGLPISTGVSGLATGVAAQLAAGTTFTIAPTGCTPSAHAGGPFGGTITLATGPCTSIVVTMNGATGYTAAHGYDCSVDDQTAQAAGTWIPKWGQSAQSTTTATIPIPAAAGATDVISFSCVPN